MINFNIRRDEKWVTLDKINGVYIEKSVKPTNQTQDRPEEHRRHQYKSYGVQLYQSQNILPNTDSNLTYDELGKLAFFYRPNHTFSRKI